MEKMDSVDIFRGTLACVIQSSLVYLLGDKPGVIRLALQQLFAQPVVVKSLVADGYVQASTETNTYKINIKVIKQRMVDGKYWFCTCHVLRIMKLDSVLSQAPLI
jgi:UDP-N-acetyl-D-mannosaminuronic acid transferase (WecB/TagA/CpsF family)